MDDLYGGFFDKSGPASEPAPGPEPSSPPPPPDPYGGFFDTSPEKTLEGDLKQAQKRVDDAAVAHVQRFIDKSTDNYAGRDFQPNSQSIGEMLDRDNYVRDLKSNVQKDYPSLSFDEEKIRDSLIQGIKSKYLQRSQQANSEPSTVDWVAERLPGFGQGWTFGKAERLKESAERVRDDKATKEDYAVIGQYLSERDRAKKRGLADNTLDLMSHLPAAVIEWVATGGAAGLAKGIGSTALRVGAEGALRTAANPMAIASQFAQRTTPDIGVGPAGPVVGEAKDRGKALQDAVVGKMIENTVFSAMGGATGIMGQSAPGIGSAIVKGTIKGTAAVEGISEAQYQAGASPQASAVRRAFGGDSEAGQELAAQILAFGGFEGVVKAGSAAREAFHSGVKEGLAPDSPAMAKKIEDAIRPLMIGDAKLEDVVGESARLRDQAQQNRQAAPEPQTTAEPAKVEPAQEQRASTPESTPVPTPAEVPPEAQTPPERGVEQPQAVPEVPVKKGLGTRRSGKVNDPQVQDEVMRLRAEGKSFGEVAEAVGLKSAAHAKQVEERVMENEGRDQSFRAEGAGRVIREGDVEPGKLRQVGGSPIQEARDKRADADADKWLAEHAAEMADLKKSGRLPPEKEKEHVDASENLVKEINRAKRQKSSPQEIAATIRRRGEDERVARQPGPAASGPDADAGGSGAVGAGPVAGSSPPAGKRAGLGLGKLKPGGSLVQAVKYYGHIDPKSAAFLAHYSGVKAALEDGIPLGVFRKGGNGLDSLAEELANNGHITRSEGEHVTETLLNALKNRKESGHHQTLDEDLEAAHNNHWLKEQEIADAKQAENEAVQAGVPRRAAQEALHDGLQDGLEDQAESFNFGTNLFGEPNPREFKSKSGQQVTMEDALREVQMQKADEWAKDNEKVIVRRQTPNKFWTDDGGAYEVGPAAKDYPITKAGEKPPKPIIQKVIDAGAEAEARLAKKFKDFTFSGVDPTLIADLTTALAGRIAKGGYDFIQFSKSAIAQFGEAIRPHIKSIWANAAADAAGKPRPFSEKPTGIKNEVVDAELARQGQEPARHGDAVTDEAVMATARKALEADPDAGRKLVDSLARDSRPLTTPETALLSLELVRRVNTRNAAQDKLVSATSEADRATARFESARASDEYKQAADVATQAGTLQAQSFRLRQLLHNSDYSLAEMERSRSAAYGRKLSETEKAEVAKSNEKIAGLEKRIKELEQQAVKSEPKRTAARKEVDEAWAEFSRLASGKLFSNPVDPQLIAAAGRLAKAYVKLGIASFKDFMAEIQDRTKRPATPEFEKVMSDAWDEAHRKQGAKTPEARRADSLKKQIDVTQKKIDAGDFSTPEKKSGFAKSPEHFKLESELARLKKEWKEGNAQIEAQDRPFYQKAMGTAAKWFRGSILSSPIVLAKLSSAAMERTVFAPMHNAVGSTLGLAVPKLYAKSVYEGKTSVGLEARSFVEGWRRWAEDAKSIWKTGETDFGHKYSDRPIDIDPSWTDFIGRLHGMLKAPAKRAAFYRALEQGTNNAVKAGLDPTDPAVEMRLGMEAFKMGNRAIFMQDNFITKKWEQFLQPVIDPKTGQQTAASATSRFIGKMTFPIVRIPTNIVIETLNHAFGTGIGAGRLAWHTVRGIEKMTPEQADQVMRHFKQGLPGLGLIVAGFLSPENFGGFYDRDEERKKKPGDAKVGEVKIGNWRVPNYLVHNPLLECLQLGATARRAADKMVKRGDHHERQGELRGFMHSLLGIADEVPFVRETTGLADLRQGSPDYAIGTKMRSLLVPQGLQWIAGNLDKNKPFNPVEDPRDRKPKTIGQHIEKGIPVLREQVPAK